MKETGLGATGIGSARGAAAIRRWITWTPLLLPLLGVGAVYLAHAVGADHLIAKRPNEYAALGLLALAVLVCLLRLAVRRDRFGLVMTAFTASLLCREIHFAGTHKGIYVAAVAIGVWVAVWRKSLLPVVKGTAKGRWLVIAAWAYLFAVLIQRRAFRFLPLERRLHVQMEEVCENIAHTLLLLACLLP